MSDTSLSPKAYAQRLATYITDPSTIRVRTLDYFGRGPSLEACKRYRADHERSVRQFRELSEGRTEGRPLPKCDDDGEPWRPRGLIMESVPKRRTEYDSADNTRRKVDHAEQERIRAQQEQAADKQAREVRSYQGLIRAVAARYGIPPECITGPSKKNLHVLPRQLLMAVLFARGNDYSQIGRWLGRDHSTIISGVRRFVKIARANPEWMRAFQHYAPDGYSIDALSAKVRP